MSRSSAFEPRRARPLAKPDHKPLKVARWRFYGVGLVLAVLVGVLIVHVASLQVLPNTDKGYEFLQDQGESRTLRTEIIPAYRGVITDRNGSPLAVSTPVSTLWANPKVLSQAPHRIADLAQALKADKADLESRLARYANKEFMYLQRQMSPEAAQAVLSLDIPGVYEQIEYHRYYPAADVAAHLVGMTDVDGRGQEGMELAYDAWLTGENGAKEVLKDLRGRTVKELRLVKAARPGQNLTLSIDLRLQYLAHRELKKAVEASSAVAGSIVILDVLTGEVLAISNLPSYNPNDRSRARGDGLRNRAITDLYEPGSTVKPWVVLAALDSGKFKPEDVIDTNPGYFMVGSKPIKDHRNYGAMDLAMAIAKSSNIAMTMTPLQVVQAYGVIASGGVKRPVSLLRVDNAPEGERVIDKKYTDQVTQMLKRVVTAEGTGSRAKAISYSVAGKTGTAYKAINGRYSEKQIASFIGMAPADNPRIVAMVIVDEPQGSGIYTNGGWVAAPAFSKVAEDALRMLQVPPDNIYQHDNKTVVDKTAKKEVPAGAAQTDKSATTTAAVNNGRSAT